MRGTRSMSSAYLFYSAELPLLDGGLAANLVEVMSAQLTEKEIRVLRSIHFLDVAVRAEIARSCGLSTVLVSSILRNLERLGLVVKGGKTHTRGGRPSAIYRLSPGLGCTVGVAVEPGVLRIVALDAGREILLEQEHPLRLSSDPQDHTDEIIRQVSTELERLFAGGSVRGHPVLSLGISPPGMVDTERGIWLQGLQVSGITHIDLRSILQERFRLPVVVEDNARAIAFREKVKGAGVGCRDFVLLYLGLGVGAGIVIGGALYRGHGGLAGEVGHLIVDSAGDRCSCGNRGCLETVVSASSILRRFQRRLEEGVISVLQRRRGNGAGGLSLERIREAAAAEDRLALSTLFEIGSFLGDACSKLIKLFNPRKIIVSGEVAMLGESFRPAIDIAANQRVIPEMLAGLEIGFADYRPAHKAEGAALVAMDAFWREVESLPVSAAASSSG